MIQVTRHGAGKHIAQIALDRPEALNAISTAMATELRAAAETVAADPSVRCVVLASTGRRSFCVGADLKERDGFDDAQLRAQREVIRAMFAAVRDLPMPSVAAVDGYALGGGLELALSCDLIVAGAGAVVGLPEVGVGLVPGGGGTQLLMRRIGRSRAAGLVLTGRHLDAAAAGDLGVVDELVEAGAATARAQELAGRIAANSPVAVRAAKEAMRRGSDQPLDVGLEAEDAAWHRAAFSVDRAEGIRAFVEKRSPDFRSDS